MAFLEETKIPYKLSPKTAVLEGKCKGLSICVSGFRDSNLEEVITNEGGKIVSGVSKNNTFGGERQVCQLIKNIQGQIIGDTNFIN